MFHFLQLCICNHMQRLRKSHSCAARKDTLCFWGETTQSGCEFWSGCSWSTSNSGSSASCTGSFSSCASPFAKTLLPFFCEKQDDSWKILQRSTQAKSSEAPSWIFPHELAHPQDKPRRVTATCGQAVAGGPRLALAQREAQVAWSVTFVMFFFNYADRIWIVIVTKACFIVTRDCCDLERIKPWNSFWMQVLNVRQSRSLWTWLLRANQRNLPNILLCKDWRVILQWRHCVYLQRRMLGGI